MKNPNIDSIYTKLNKHILLAQGYTEIPELQFIIESCRLKPYEYICNKTNKLVLQTWWVDEFGNSLIITKKKKLKIIYNDLSIDRKKLICTDLYYGLSLENILKISKTMYISYGRDEDFYQDCIMISFLGIDNYLRTYLYMYGEWQQLSSLCIGIKSLQQIAKNKNIRYFNKLRIFKDIGLPCREAEVWLSCVPPLKEFNEILEKQCGIAYSILKLRSD